MNEELEELNEELNEGLNSNNVFRYLLHVIKFTLETKSSKLISNNCSISVTTVDTFKQRNRYKTDEELLNIRINLSTLYELCRAKEHIEIEKRMLIKR